MSAIAIFVKTPGLSAIKTRLAETIGSQTAEQWHRLAAQATAEVAVASEIGPVYWAVAEPEGTNHMLWRHLPHLVQSAGGLGERMATIYNALIETHGRAILLGADTPQIDPASLRKAAQWLNVSQARQVIGPATDGGFWLYGGNRSACEHLWGQVAYSQSDTLEQFQYAMSEQGDWLRLDQKTDVDRAKDLSCASQALIDLATPSPTQARLIQWLEQVTLAGN